MCSPQAEQAPPNRIPTVAVIAAVVLAAGMSRRMGRPKMLLPFGGIPLLARVLESLFAGGAAECIVVTGHGRADVERIVAGFPAARAVHNERYATGGMLSSVQAGVAALTGDTDAFLVAPGDQPMVRPETVQALIEAWAATRAPVVLPVHAGRRGHPVLLSSEAAGEVMELPDGATLRDVISRHADDLVTVSVNDPAVLHDVDTPDDYARALREWEALTAPSGA